jgi:hypothetical protein
MKPAAALYVVLAAFLWIGCGKSDSNSILVVTVTAPPTMPVVTQLRAIVSNAGSSNTRLFPQVQSATPIQFDTTFAVTFPTSRSGELAITVEAIGSGPQVVASGSDSVVIAPGGRADVIVRLALVVAGDAGTPDAFGATDVGTASETGVADGKSASDVLKIGIDARELGGGGGIPGSGGRYGTGGATSSGGVIGVGGSPFVGGATGSTGGIVSSGGVMSTGGRIGAGGVLSTGGVLGSGGSGGGSIAACANATPISGSVSLNTTSAFCFVTCDGSTMGWGCDSFTEKDRTVKVNGTFVTCGGTLPAQKTGGYYYFEIGAGGQTWDAIHLNGPKATSCPVPAGGFSP